MDILWRFCHIFLRAGKRQHCPLFSNKFWTIAHFATINCWRVPIKKVLKIITLSFDRAESATFLIWFGHFWQRPINHQQAGSTTLIMAKSIFLQQFWLIDAIGKCSFLFFAEQFESACKAMTQGCMPSPKSLKSQKRRMHLFACLADDHRQTFFSQMYLLELHENVYDPDSFAKSSFYSFFP